MKKSLLLVFIVLIPLIKCQAQHVFAPVGAEWWYGGDVYDCANPLAGQPQASTWTDHVKATGDTIINGITCTILKAARIKSINGNLDTVSTQIFTYDNTDTVFIYNDSIANFAPLYIFNVHPGDTITYNQTSPPFSYIVDSIGYVHESIDSLKTIYTHTLDSISSPHAGYNWGCYGYASGGLKAGSYSQKIGMHDANIYGFFPIWTNPIADGLTFGTFPMGRLRCYSDTATSIVYGSVPCDSVAIPLGVNNITKLKILISIAPNPASSQINIQPNVDLKSETVIEAYDILGRQILKPISIKTTERFSIDVRNWISGVYFLNLKIGMNHYYQKIVIQH